MAISSKDIETLFGRYQIEGVNKIGFVSPERRRCMSAANVIRILLGKDEIFDTTKRFERQYYIHRKSRKMHTTR